jgi:alkylation response protein AidB-like acyl-CoA dehydrogenase
MRDNYKSAVAEFVRDHILGNERALDARNAEVPGPPCAAFHRAGLGNWWISPEFGGRGLSLADSVDIVEELAYGDAGLAFTLFISILSTKVLELFGSADQKRRYLGDFVTTGGYAAMMGSEKNAGSELLRIATTAAPSGTGYVLNGDKYFCTNAAFARFVIVIAATADEAAGFKAFLIPKDTPGVIIRRRWNVAGIRSSAQYEIGLENVMLPAESVIQTNGMRVLEAGLNFSRVLIAATAIGVARRVRDLALQYAQTKRIKEAPLRQNHVFMAKLGQMEADIACMRAVCKAAARDLDEMVGAPDTAALFARVGSVKSALVAKLICGQIGFRVAAVGSELFGGLGYTEDHLAEKLLRDVRFVAIVEGGEDVLRELLYSRFVRAITPSG